MKRLSLAVVMCLMGTTTFAQEPSKGWIDVNFGVAQAAEDAYTSAKSDVVFQETRAGAVAYAWPRGADFDFGGGYMFHPRVGVGISFSGTAHKSIAGLAITVPHPTQFNRAASDADVTAGELTRAEGGVNIQVMLVAAETPRLRLRVFGGPTHFRAKQDTVTIIRYDQVYNLLGFNSINITTYDSAEHEASGWGAHGGFDVSYFFSRVVGIGGIVRVSRGAVDLDDYGGVSNVKVGGVQYGGGLRLRFGE